MKKLFILVISTIAPIPFIFTMEKIEITKEKALVCASKNANILFGESKAEDASRIICSLSLVNKNLYDQMNDPVTTCIIINHLANKYNKPDTVITGLLTVPGVKKYNELNEGLLNCISKEFYLPNIMQKLISSGANPDIALFHVWQQIKAPRPPDITAIPITKIIANTDQILDFNNNLNKQFKFLCRQQAFDKKILTEIRSLATMIKSIMIALLKFNNLYLVIDHQEIIDPTTMMKGLIIEDFLQSLADKLTKNQPRHNIEQDPS